MTVFLCCDSDSGRADEMRNTEEKDGGGFTLHIKDGDGKDWKRHLE